MVASSNVPFFVVIKLDLDTVTFQEKLGISTGANICPDVVFIKYVLNIIAPLNNLEFWFPTNVQSSMEIVLVPLPVTNRAAVKNN